MKVVNCIIAFLKNSTKVISAFLNIASGGYAYLNYINAIKAQRNGCGIFPPEKDDFVDLLCVYFDPWQNNNGHPNFAPYHAAVFHCMSPPINHSVEKPYRKNVVEQLSNEYQATIENLSVTVADPSKFSPP